MRPTVLLCTLFALCFWISPADAQPLGPNTELLPPPAYTDSALPTGIAGTSVGVTLVALGALLQDEPEQGAVLGAGLGTLAVSVPMLVVGSGRVRYARESEGAYAAGSVLASIGGTLSGAGIGWAIGEQARSERYEREFNFVTYGPNRTGPLAFGLVGLSLGLSGSALMAYGASELDPQDAFDEQVKRAQRMEEAKRAAGSTGTIPRSIPRRTTGQVFTIIGGASFAGGTLAAIAFSGCSGDFCGFGHIFTTIPLMAHGVITSAIGIPLWVSGATHVRPEELAEAETLIPEVSIGAGSATVRMLF